MSKNNYLFSNKGKKQFNKLSKSNKKVVMEAAISDTVSKVMRDKITTSMITGMRLQLESLYKSHVKNLDSMETGSSEWISCVEKLLSEIRVGHVNYEKMVNGEEKADGEGK